MKVKLPSVCWNDYYLCTFMNLSQLVQVRVRGDPWNVGYNALHPPTLNVGTDSEVLKRFIPV